VTTPTETIAGWRTLAPRDSAALAEARGQLHHALQIIVSAPISYLAPRADDSHTSLEWLPEHQALGTHWLDGGTALRFALSLAELALIAVTRAGSSATFTLHGATVSQALDWMRGILARHGYEPSRLTASKHYEIPAHAVASGSPFSRRDDAAFTEMAHCYANGQALCTYVAALNEGASHVRCWPHHFDIATLITLPGAATRTIGVGMAPGDHLYPEPYFYVGPYPSPDPAALPPLSALGGWHTEGWIGAALPHSRVAALPTPAAQAQAVRAFADAAVSALRRVLGD
jgi:hypothetical protein